MFPIDPSWAYVGVPAVLVSILVLIKLRQEKTDENVESESSGEGIEEVHPTKKEAAGESSVEVKEPQAKPESSEETKPENCSHYLGYLYMQKAPDKTHIPSECYGCRKLLQCLYSPRVMEQVYGK